MLVYDAWLKMKKRFGLFYYEVSNGEDTVQFSPTHYVSITKTEPRKRLACYAHASQTPDRYYAACKTRSCGCAASKADIAWPKASCGTFRVPSSLYRR